VKRLALALLLLTSCTPALVTAPSASPPVRTDAVGNVLEPTMDPAIWAQLEARPLRLPSLAPGVPCPVSASAMFAGSATAAASGDGPLFAVTGGDAIALGVAGADGLRGGKVLWIARPEYKGIALIRAARLDGSSDILFTAGRKTLQFELDTRTRAGDATSGSALGWRYLPSTVYLVGAGCYGFQIDMPDGAAFVTLAAKVQIP
jgi:hypothetical protein